MYGLRVELPTCSASLRLCVFKIIRDPFDEIEMESFHNSLGKQNETAAGTDRVSRQGAWPIECCTGKLSTRCKAFAWETVS